MSVESFTSRRPLILDAFRRCGGHLTEAELAVPEVAGPWWRQELHAMRTMGYDLHEQADGWHLVGDPKIVDPPAPPEFDFNAALRAVTAKGRELDSRRSGNSGDGRIASLNIVNGHRPSAPRRDRPYECADCGLRWDDGLLARACVRAKAA